MSAQGTKELKGRRLKALIFELLDSDNALDDSEVLRQISPKAAVNPLLSFLLHPDGRIRDRAVSALGETLSILAKSDMESARNVMRRLMWSLNDESGGIGWGAPEAMGEIMARHRGLAVEYSSVFVSYLNPAGNFLEHEPLQRDLLKGLIKASSVHRDLFTASCAYLPGYACSTDAEIIVSAYWAEVILKCADIRFPSDYKALNHFRVELYLGSQLVSRSLEEIMNEYKPEESVES